MDCMSVREVYCELVSQVLVGSTGRYFQSSGVRPPIDAVDYDCGSVRTVQSLSRRFVRSIGSPTPTAPRAIW